MSEQTVDFAIGSKLVQEAAAKSARKPAKKAKAAKKLTQTKKAATQPKAGRTKKKAEVVALMKRAKGPTLSEIMATTG